MSNTVHNIRIPASEAILYAMYREWVSVEEFSQRMKQQDVLWDICFSTLGVRQDAARRWKIYDIAKQTMLIFVKRLANDKEWTEQEWEQQQSNLKVTKQAIQKCVNETLEKFGFTIQELHKKLVESLTHEQQTAVSLANAKTDFLRECRNENLKIYGKTKHGEGNIEAIGADFLNRPDIDINLYTNSFAALPAAQTTSPKHQLDAIAKIGWHGLEVRKEALVTIYATQANQNRNQQLALKGRDRWLPAIEQINKLVKGKNALTKESAIKRLFDEKHSSVKGCSTFASYKRQYITATEKYGK